MADANIIIKFNVYVFKLHLFLMECFLWQVAHVELNFAENIR
jgi:hypothetical protein